MNIKKEYIKQAILVLAWIGMTEVIPAIPLMVPFLLNRASLYDTAQDLAKDRDILLIPPQGAADLEALKAQRVSYTPSIGDRIPLPQAWELTKTFLEMSGFSLVQKNERTFAIVRESSIEGGAAHRDILPLYIDPRPEDLPRSDSRVRALIYLRNIKVPTLAEKERHPLTNLIKELGSKYVNFIFEPRSNGILITDLAPHAASIIHIIDAFDKRGGAQEIAYIPLAYVKATDIANIFDSLKKASAPAEGAGQVESSAAPFGSDTTVIADTMRNGIILMGYSDHLEKITDFITESLDVPQENGKSILHSYDLEYLDAATFAPALQKIVGSLLVSGQATQAPVRRGQEHFFKGVQVVAEGSVEIKIKQDPEWPVYDQKGYPEAVGIEGATFRGSNRIIVAARQDDWRIIEQFIKKIDKPNLQVILEIMIVNFAYDHTTTLATTVRSKTDSAILSPGVQFLSSQISSVNSVLGNTPTQLAEDLLQMVGPGSLTTTLSPGPLIISLNDPTTPGIFGLIQILETIMKTQIFSYPYLMISNNQKGTVESEEIRRPMGDLVTTQNGTYTIPVIDLPAATRITAVPHIVSPERVRLDIGFTMDTFVGTSFTRLTQSLNTTATLASGQILVMGGLARIDRNDTITQTPFLGSIPILGAFFRGRTEETTRTNLIIFVSPTIIRPRHKNELATDKTRDLVCRVQEGNIIPLESDRDPVFRLFLKSPPDSTFNTYFPESDNLPELRDTTCIVLPEQKIHDLKNTRRSASQRSDFFNPFGQVPPSGQGVTQRVLPDFPKLFLASTREIINKNAAIPSWAKPQKSIDRLKELLATCDKPFIRV